MRFIVFTDQLKRSPKNSIQKNSHTHEHTDGMCSSQLNKTLWCLQMCENRGVIEVWSLQFMLDCVLQRAQMMLNGAARDLISKTTEVSLGEKEM